MKPKEVKEVIHTSIKKPDSAPPMHLWGPPGIGKSAVVKQVAEESHIGFKDLRLTLCDPTDLRGIPVPEDGGAKWLPPSELPRDGNGILFLDELNVAPPLVQASAYQLILDRALGEYHLPDGWYMMAAGNRLEDRAVVHRMPSALANRFWHIDFEVNLDDWVDWAITNEVDTNIISFLNFRPELLMAFNPESSEKAFPTPRTWEFASKVIGMIKNKRLLSESLDGVVGKGASTEFSAFLKLQTALPDLDTIFGGNDFVPETLDLKYALVSALAIKAKSNQYERLIQYSENLPVEFAVLMMKLLASINQGALHKAPSWSKWARAHYDVII